MIVWVLAVAACDETVRGQQPVGGDIDTDAEIQRYLRRAYLDLTGRVPTDADLAAATLRLRDAANTPSARVAFVDELVGQDAFARVWVDELENAIFGGNTLAQQYSMLCELERGTVPACASCTQVDPCLCACGELPTYKAERDELATSAAALLAGTASSEIERRYAGATGYFDLGGEPESRVRTLFDDFLSRPAEPEEIENGRAMIFGSFFPGSPAGLLFHRHGGSYEDLIDIVWSSDIYREAMVRRIFARYLAREPSSAELAHFTVALDAEEPDARALVRAVVASREYFEQ